MKPAHLLMPDVTTSAIAAALHTLGAETSQTTDAARAARTLLEAQPLETLAPEVTLLWERAEGRRQRRDNLSNYALGAVVLLGIALLILGFLGLRPRAWDRWTWLLMFPFVLEPVLVRFTRLSATHKGIMHLVHLRPDVAFVPLLIDTLVAHRAGEGTEQQQATRVLLTRLLPLWCEQDNDDLTPRRRKILVGQIDGIAHSGTGLYRPLDAPRPAMNLEDADFALAAIATLRRCHTSAADRRITRVLSRLPAAVTSDDPRHEVRLAAEAYLTQGRR